MFTKKEKLIIISVVLLFLISVCAITLYFSDDHLPDNGDDLIRFKKNADYFNPKPSSYNSWYLASERTQVSPEELTDVQTKLGSSFDVSDLTLEKHYFEFENDENGKPKTELYEYYSWDMEDGTNIGLMLFDEKQYTYGYRRFAYGERLSRLNGVELGLSYNLQIQTFLAVTQDEDVFFNLYFVGPNVNEERFLEILTRVIDAQKNI